MSKNGAQNNMKSFFGGHFFIEFFFREEIRAKIRCTPKFAYSYIYGLDNL